MDITTEALRFNADFLVEEGYPCAATNMRDAADEIERLRAEIVGGNEGQWQPMETAPKDGTLFMTYAAPGQHDLPAMFSLCAWHPDAGFCICELREPTHWRPLPDAPKRGVGRGANPPSADNLEAHQ